MCGFAYFFVHISGVGVERCFFAERNLVGDDAWAAPVWAPGDVGEHRYTVYMYLCVYLDIQDRETLGYYFLATIQRTRYVSQLDLPITYSIQVKNYIYIVEFTVYRILKSYICNCLKKRSKFGVF